MSTQSPTPNPHPPVSYTPAHLADRIRSVTITDGERKTITALFADLKGSTALIEGLDPEEARTIIDPALQLMMDAVHQYDGFVAQALGDGIFALFGAPLAHEDHPQRAVYAALRMQDAMRRYGETLRSKGYPPLQMRVGLNTGEVVLRSIRKDDLHADYVPVGHSTNLAARMEQLATPGTIVVSAYTHRLIDGYFAFKDLGPTQIKGVEELLNLYEVVGVGPLRTRLQASASRYGLTRFVGRQRELEQLTNALEQAKAGQGQIVGTMGEPGLGKSRLFHEFVGAQHAAPLQSLKQLILDKTQGTPFFMEEIVQELVEQGVLVRTAVGVDLRVDPQRPGAHGGAPLRIPTTVQAVLAARIDRLAPDEKALLQQLAVIGRQFPMSLIRQVIAQPEADLYRLLASLQHKEFLYEQPAFPESEYIFKHALTQEVAYGTVLQEQRKALHERTGQAMEALYLATLPEHYSDLAHHYRRSADTEKAITYLQLAGQQAVQRSANAEAISHLTTALDLLVARPETPGRAAQELALRLAVGPALMSAQGWTTPAAEPHYTRALALCAQLGDALQRMTVLWSL
ncbi:MAG: adenylate/guanylate cyclase domain-containing protein [Candidatus Binatia bacterium]